MSVSSAIAQNRTALKKLGITHVLNAAHTKQGSIGDQDYYGDAFVYHGIAADDSSKFDINVYFRQAADFIHKSLEKKDGKILYKVHVCAIILNIYFTLI